MPTTFSPQSLRALREQKGLTQTALALRMNIDQSFISMIESGKAEPSMQTLTALADALGVRVDRLFRYDNGKQAA